MPPTFAELAVLPTACMQHLQHLKRLGRQAALAACAVSCLTVAAPASANVVVVLNSRDATISLLDQTTYEEIKSIRSEERRVGKECW